MKGKRTPVSHAFILPTSSFRKRKVWESNPQKLSLRQFSGLLGMPVPNLPRLAGTPGLEPGLTDLESACLPLTYPPPLRIRRDSNPQRPSRATALQAAAEPIRPLMQIFF